MGNLFPEGLQPSPGILVQEAQGHIKRGPAPALQRSGIPHDMPCGGGCPQQVMRAHACGQQALVGIPPAANPGCGEGLHQTVDVQPPGSGGGTLSHNRPNTRAA